MENKIREIVLKNAVVHGGKAETKAVVNKLLGQSPELRSRTGEIIPLINRIIAEVNRMALEEQKSQIMAIDKSFFSSQRKEKKELPPLPDARDGKVVTRLPPEPNGYPHIGHGLSFYFNYYYAKRYDGKVVLRFDDTNPKAEKLEFYEAIRKDLEWMGLEWDAEHNMSDDMEAYYVYASKLVEMGKAYICKCPSDKVSKLRFGGNPCPCREWTVEENTTLWEKLFDAREGECVLRLKGDMSSKNTAMRDPTMFRIIDYPHPIYGNKYRVWPVYDFACAIEDSILGITHVLRSNEFALRIELQDTIREMLGLRSPQTIQYSRFTIRGTPTAKRLIRPLIENGIVTGWDDPRLVTLRGLKRRGIVPQTIRGLAREMGLSTAEPEIDWSLVESINRKIIDPTSKRFFYVEDPVGLKVDGIVSENVSLRMHPEKELGARELHIDGDFFITRDDANDLKVGDIVRLKDLCNIKIRSIGKMVESFRCEENVNIKDIKKIHWVPRDCVRVRVMMPSSLYNGKDINPLSLRWSDGFGEKSITALDAGEIVQFERFGFVRIDSKKDGIQAILSHR
ncbi:MAG: glutamate--tRNA ligase [Candidatus Methanofastidiosia archaeon]